MSKLEQIVEQLGKNNPLDAAVAGCVTTIFHSISRTAEFTQKTLTSFDPLSHVKPSDVKKRTDRNGLEVTSFSLPKTKCSDEPEDAYWSKQSGVADPEANFNNHIAINSPPSNGPLFAYKHGNGHKPLTHKVFLDRLNEIALALGLGPLKGHGLRIGGTLEYLLQGVPFDIVKSLGRWSSEAFVLYLHQHAVIMAPYLQSSPVLETFTRYTMPPVQN